MKSSQQQTGFSLVELMIAMTLGLLITGAIFSVYNNSRSSQRYSAALARIQENGRTGLHILTTVLRLAGYREDPDSNFSSLFVGNSNFPVNTAIVGSDNDNDSTNGIKDGTDWLMVRYQGDSTTQQVFDCIGNPLPINDASYPNNIFPTLFAVSDNNELFCDPGITGAGGRKILVGGVENLQIQYGIDTSGDGTADYYIDASQNPDFSFVISIRLSLLLQSQDRVTSQPQSYTYNNITTSDPGDLRLRAVFDTTLVIRNVSN